MKKLIYFASILCFLIAVKYSYSQWLQEVQLTTNTNGVLVNGRTVAVRGNFVHTVWTDLRNTDLEIYYRRSTDGGTTWEPESRFTNHTGSSIFPQVSVYNSNVHVLWQDDRDGNTEIYYKRSTDDGVTWDPVTRLTNNSASSAQPVLSATGVWIYAVWTDGRNGNDKIFFKRSVDGGVTWGSDIQISNGPDGAVTPSVCSISAAVYISWQDYRDGNPEIYFKRSTDWGATWGPETRLTNNSAISFYPSITISTPIVSVFWQDERDGHPEIYYKRSTDGGIIWTTDTRMTNGVNGSRNVCAAASGLYLHYVWEEIINSSKEIMYKNSSDGGFNWSTRMFITPQGGIDSGYNPSIDASGTGVHVTWKDTRNGNRNMLYYRKNPTNGNPTAITNINLEIPKGFSLSQNYPNPFNPNTKINFSIPQKSNITIKIYNSLGIEISELVNEEQEAGNYSVDFDGSKLATGVYFYRITAGTFIDTKKMILTK